MRLQLIGNQSMLLSLALLLTILLCLTHETECKLHRLHEKGQHKSQQFRGGFAKQLGRKIKLQEVKNPMIGFEEDEDENSDPPISDATREIFSDKEKTAELIKSISSPEEDLTVAMEASRFYEQEACRVSDRDEADEGEVVFRVVRDRIRSARCPVSALARTWSQNPLLKPFYYAYLLLKSVRGRIIPSSTGPIRSIAAPASPKREIRVGKFAYKTDATHPPRNSMLHKQLMRLLWIGSQYAYNQANHYKPRNSDTVERYHVEWIHSATPTIADAAVALVTPALTELQEGIQHPTFWYCQRSLPGADTNCPLEDSDGYLHVAFRGMQLSFRLTTPPLDDVINMRGLTELVTCRVKPRSFVLASGERFRETTLELEITHGVCLMLQQLINYDHLFETLVARIYAMTSTKKYLLFQGLSYGGALAQAAVVYFSMYLAVQDITNTYLGLAIFGAPRVGKDKFLDAFEASGIVADHFVMQTYLEQSTPGAQITLQYDPIAFWPEDLYMLPRVHSLIYYYDSLTIGDGGEVVVADISANIMADREEVGALSPFPRSVPPMDYSAFNCLHLFPKYKGHLEGVASRDWCHRSHHLTLDVD